MENLSNIQTVIITPIGSILPLAAVIGLILGAANGLLMVAIRRWQSNPPMPRGTLIRVLSGCSLIGTLLLTVVAFCFWDAGSP